MYVAKGTKARHALVAVPYLAEYVTEGHVNRVEDHPNQSTSVLFWGIIRSRENIHDELFEKGENLEYLPKHSTHPLLFTSE